MMSKVNHNVSQSQRPSSVLQPTMICNPITIKELENRSSNSKPIYFDNCFIPLQFYNAKLKLDDITPDMVHQFLVRYYEDSECPFTTVTVTEAHKENVLNSMNAIKKFFKTKGKAIARKRIIDYYNEHYLRQGSKKVENIQHIFYNEEDMTKVSEWSYTYLYVDNH